MTVFGKNILRNVKIYKNIWRFAECRIECSTKYSQ